MVEAPSSGQQQQKILDTMLWWAVGKGQGTVVSGSVTSIPEAHCYLSSGSYWTSLPQGITPLFSPKPPVAPADPGPLLPKILLTVGRTTSALLVFTMCVRAQWLQSGPTLCDPVDCSPPGSSVHGDSPGKNTGVGCHALLQGIFLTQGGNPRAPASLVLAGGILYHYCHLGSPVFTTGSPY
ncbi:unnamed protein product [Rangifer tarandus platyrhynchus]|uniref:Uncharacterized protein n=1 Tax=Rangifer tarandus platyrhynchus TaxID=3082113 RepID=A0AC59ZM44_RANTA